MAEETMQRPDVPNLVQRRPPTMDQFIIERFKLDPKWEHAGWKKEGMDPKTGDCKFILVTGAVYPEITRGRRKGHTNYKKPEPGTFLSVSVIPDEMDQWMSSWEKETGYCSKCSGTGHAWSGWSAERGNRYTPCKHCSATGKLSP
jgi:hypothetical protein